MYWSTILDKYSRVNPSQSWLEGATTSLSNRTHDRRLRRQLVLVHVHGCMCLTPPIPGDTSRRHVLVVRAGVSRLAGSRECVTHGTTPTRLFCSLAVVIKREGARIKVVRHH